MKEKIINAKRYKEIWKEISFKKGTSIIDIGGREGYLIKFAAKGFQGSYRNFDILDGNDISNQVKKEFIGMFDYVIFSHAIEHLENAGNALENVRKLMKEDGKLIILVPNCLSIRKIVRNILGLQLESYGKFETHLASYNKESLSYLLERKGYNIQKIKFIDQLCSFFGVFSEEILIVAK